MGAFKSKIADLSNNDIKELKKRMTNAETLDGDGDGIVTKKELVQWEKNQKKLMETLQDKLEDKIHQKYTDIIVEKESIINKQQLEIDDLKKQINGLKNINRGLEKDLFKKIDDQVCCEKPDKGKITQLSQKRIHEFVQNMLKDPNVNISYLPDWVEEKIYINVFMIMMGILDETLSSTSVRFLGHNMTFNFEPLKDDELSEEDEEEKC